VEWRSHWIVPVSMLGDISSVNNYHPISLLCSISEVLEKLIFDKVSAFIAPNISVSQFSFVRNRSTFQQLLLYCNFLIQALDNHQQVDTIYIDIRKASDTVLHTNLLCKLWNIGISGSIWNL
jgi:hypothetical protein